MTRVLQANGATLAAADAVARATALADRHGERDGLPLLRAVLADGLAGRVALVSAFGAESAVLLDMVARVAPETPVLFLDTGKLFGETLRYRDQLARRLGLRDLRVLRPDSEQLAVEDPDGVLWARDPDRCCYLRKVAPLARALGNFDTWITGRKRSHGAARSRLPTIEAAGAQVKINPLAGWSPAEIDAYFVARDLPWHPLVADGYLSIGCLPCTDRVQAGDDPRSGRWRGLAKTECGIHLPLPRADLTAATGP